MGSIELVTCPYDEVHRVKRSRLQLHITKCRQNHLDAPKFTCPFNATHVLPVHEKLYHLSVCDDRAPMDRYLVRETTTNTNPYRGRLAVPSYFEPPPVPASELWDNEISNNGPCFVPPKQAPFGAIIEPPPLSKPAERRKLYKELHTRPLSETDARPGNETYKNNQPVKPQASRQPSEAPKIVQCTRHLPNVGLGRARGAAPSRIAANIFPGSSSSFAQQINKDLIPNFSNLGIGRGISNGTVGITPVFGDSDFPALGLGRAAAATHFMKK